MKFLKFLLLAFLPLLFLPSCETDFDINAPWKDITLVYGVLNQNDTVHYIRIQKAYLGEGNALLMAQIPDSNLYPNKLNVQLQEYNGIMLLRTINFDTISMLDKEPGIFFHPVQPVYFTNATLNPNYTYKLHILNQTTQKEITATTEMVRDFAIDRPGFGQNLNFTAAPDTPIAIKWFSAEYGKRYQVILRFNYKEVVSGSTDTLYKHLDWHSSIVKANALSGGESIEIKFSKITLFSMITNNIQIQQEVIRYSGMIDLIFYAAADDLSTFIEVNEPSSGIVQEKPEFTNITNGIGLFSARYDKIRSHRLHPSTIDQIAGMEGYNFVGNPF